MRNIVLAVVRRLGLLLVALVAVSLVIFFAIHVLPGDLATVIAGVNAAPTRVEALRAQLGLNQPLIIQYLNWLQGVCTGNLGVSAITGRPVAALLLSRASITLPLIVIALVLSLLLGVGLGVCMVVSRSSVLQACLHVAGLVGGAVPALWGGLLCMLFFARGVGLVPLFPSQGFVGDGWGQPLLALYSLILPAVSVAVIVAATFMRYTGNILKELSYSPVIDMAMAQGMTRQQAIVRVGLRLALPRLVSVTGLTFAQMITGVLVIENLFALPGLGAGLMSDIGNRDYVSVQSELLLLAAVFLCVGMLVDFLHYLLDPRLRLRSDKR